MASSCMGCCSTGSATILASMAAVGLIVGILGLTGGTSMTTVGVTSIVTSFTPNPLGFLQFIFGILGLTQTLPMAAVSGVLIASSGVGLVIAIPSMLLSCAGWCYAVRNSKEQPL